MYRVTKVLNHNAVLAVEQGNNAQCLLLGKGIGFGKRLAKRSIPQWEPVCIIYRNIKIVVVLILSLNR